MATPRGEVRISAGEKDYRVVYSVNGLCALEEAAGVPAPEFFERMQGGKPAISDLRLLLWAGFVEHHPDLSPEAVGRIANEAGGLQAVMPKVQAAIEAAFPKGEAAAGEAGAGA